MGGVSDMGSTGAVPLLRRRHPSKLQRRCPGPVGRRRRSGDELVIRVHDRRPGGVEMCGDGRISRAEGLDVYKRV